MHKYFKHTTLLLAVICLTLSVNAQVPDRIQKLVSAERYAEAERVLTRKVKHEPQNTELNETLGFVAMKLQDYKKAETYFEHADLLAGLSDAGLVQYGQVLLKNGKSDKSRLVLERYIKRDPDSFIAQLMLRSISKVGEWTGTSEAFELRGTEDLNSSFSEFAPTVIDEGLVFTTARDVDHVNESTTASTGDPFYATYYAPFGSESVSGYSFKRARPWLSNLNHDGHVGPVAVDTAQDKLYYTVVPSSYKADERPQAVIYEARLIKGKRIKKPSKLINADSFAVAHPTLSADGNTIIFASNMEGSTGGMDLYTMQKEGGAWSAPTNLSEVINTPLNEVFPYLKDDSTLYFASDGHAGYGGLDILVSKKRNGKWGDPANLKSPINSSKDDFGIAFINDTKGFFSSGREDGQGKDDIYGFIKLAEIGDTVRTEISGVFEYDDLPEDGVTLVLLDENENLLGSVQTDSNGMFDFKRLPAGEDYSIQVLNPTDDMLLNANIFILNEEGEKVQVLAKEGGASFVYQTLPKDEIAALASLDESDESLLGTYDLFGQLFDELAKDFADIELLAYDQDGNLIASVNPDEKGYYEFKALPKSEYLIIRTKNYEDSTIYRSSVFYADELSIEKVEDLKHEHFEVDANLKPKAIPPQPSAKVDYRGFVMYQNIAVPDIPIVVFDSNKRIVDVIRTNERGGFELTSTAPNMSYRVMLPDTFADKVEAPEVYLIQNTTNKIVNAERLTDFRTFAFTSLPPVEDQLNTAELDYLTQPLQIEGQIYEKLPGDYNQGMTLYAYDADGNLIETVTTDEDGNFKFTKLRPDVVYSFEHEITDGGEMSAAGLSMLIFDEQGNTQDTVALLDFDGYAYERLEGEKSARLEAIAEEDFSSPLLDEFVTGQIYYQLPGDYKEGIKVYAFDDDGNIIDSTYTDGKGGFTFKKLGRVEDFSIKVEDPTADDQLKVALFNYDGSFKGLLFLDDDNSFKYSKIVLEAAAELDGESEMDQSQGLLYGQVYKKLPGDYQEELAVYAFDAEGNLVDVAEMDGEGKFRFTKLTKEQDYVFKLSEEDTEFNLALLDEDGNVIDKDRGFDGEYQYSKLKQDEYRMQSLAAADSKLDASSFMPEEEPEPKAKTATKPIKPLPEGAEVFYFDHQSNALTSEQKQILNRLAESAAGGANRAVIIESHIDISERKGQTSYSAQRTASIARYINGKGVSLTQMHVKNLEYDEPAIDCETGCNEAEKAKNRRTVVRIVDLSEVLPEPDYVITYGFNEWKLNDQGEAEAYRLIKALRANPDAHVRIDGFTDAVGSFDANKRISELRAANLRNLLVIKGVSEDDIDIHYHGESQPEGDCIIDEPCSSESRANNRRTEVRLD